jgi:hypothetical protein
MRFSNNLAGLASRSSSVEVLTALVFPCLAAKPVRSTIVPVKENLVTNDNCTVVIVAKVFFTP